MSDTFTGDSKPFPIQSGSQSRGSYMLIRNRSTIPWWLAEIAYEEYARKYGNRQSLQRLSERGGFCPHELVELLRRKG